MKLSVQAATPLSRHTAYRTGGVCDAWVVAHDDEAVVAVLRDCSVAKWPLTVFGTGSRVVVQDGGMHGVCLRLGSGFMGLEQVSEDVIEVGGAVPVAAVLGFAAGLGLVAEIEHYTVCGTMGASALVDDWDLVSVDVARAVKRGRAVRTMDPIKVGHRTKGVILRARVRFVSAGREEAEQRLRVALRRAPTPPGSWVKGGAVRTVLVRAALDRVRLRQVAIPAAAPELLVNLGSGTARDLRLLHRSALDRVWKSRGVKLKTRMKWIGLRENPYGTQSSG